MYPILLDLKDRPVLVVGGGQVAARKIAKLLRAGARVSLVSPDSHPDIDLGQIEWIQRDFAFADMEGFSIIFACTDDEALNLEIYQRSTSLQWVNNTSDKSQSDFYNMATIDTENYSFSISTGGRSPKATRLMRQALEGWLVDRGEKLK